MHPQVEDVMKTLMITVLVALGATLPAQAYDRELTLDFDADDLERIYVSGSVGSMDVRVGDDDSIHIRVTLEPQDDIEWGDDDDVEDGIDGAELEHEMRDDRATVRVRYPRGTDEGDDIEETWTVLMPARLAGRFSMNVGSLEIVGIAGGIDASVNVGELEIDVPGGDIDAEVNVGEIDIYSESDSIGDISVDTDVGGARLNVEGRRIDGDRGWVGESIRHRGRGDDDIDASSNVGDVSVRVGS
jgi:hypothetical protein